MKLIVISPESSDRREIALVREMFARGLECYHVRKPIWSVDALSEYLPLFTLEERKKIVLHRHPNVVLEFGLAGAHWSDEGDVPQVPDQQFGVRSRACHDLLAVRTSLGHFETVFLSPVFPTISKPGYGLTRGWTDREAMALLHSRNPVEHSTAVFALGGIDESTTQQAGALGFDGVATLGAIWRSADPLTAFEKILETCRSFSAAQPPAARREPLGAFSISH